MRRPGPHPERMPLRTTIVIPAAALALGVSVAAPSDAAAAPPPSHYSCTSYTPLSYLGPFQPWGQGSGCTGPANPQGYVIFDNPVPSGPSVCVQGSTRGPNGAMTVTGYTCMSPLGLPVTPATPR
jgi:hypothetical protein